MHIPGLTRLARYLQKLCSLTSELSTVALKYSVTLPLSKQRFPAAVCVINKEALLCADRQHSLHVFRISEVCNHPLGHLCCASVSWWNRNHQLIPCNMLPLKLRLYTTGEITLLLLGDKMSAHWGVHPSGNF